MRRIQPANLLALIGLTFTAVALLRAEERMRTGLWEVSTISNGKPTGVLDSTCYTPAMLQVANMPAKMMQEASETAAAKRGCTLKDFKMDGGTISMVRICPTRSSVISSTYGGDTFETIDTSTKAGVTKVMHIKGRRVGDCK